MLFNDRDRSWICDPWVLPAAAESPRGPCRGAADQWEPQSYRHRPPTQSPRAGGLAWSAHEAWGRFGADAVDMLPLLPTLLRPLMPTSSWSRPWAHPDLCGLLALRWNDIHEKECIRTRSRTPLAEFTSSRLSAWGLRSPAAWWLRLLLASTGGDLHSTGSISPGIRSQVYLTPGAKLWKRSP